VRLRTLGSGFGLRLDLDFDLGLEQRCVVGSALGSVPDLGLRPLVEPEPVVTVRLNWKLPVRATVEGVMESGVGQAGVRPTVRRKNWRSA
jgi:hypothetical protein